MTEKERDAKGPSGEEGKDTWYLEDVYPNPNLLLEEGKHVSANDNSAIVVLDTNVLLLPYNVGSQELPKIIEVYRKLVSQNRLFVPVRVVREFIKNRDEKLSEILEKLNNSSSQLGVPSVTLPPLLQGIGEATAVSEAVKQLQAAKNGYLKSLEALREIIGGWRANDPVSVAYKELFTQAQQIDHDQARDKVEQDWATRKSRQIPPGYKDKSKPDGGIGDYLIWLSILKLGKDKELDLIFVTGEEKPDWFVRSIYPRPELIDEYRRASNGKSLRLSKLADVLIELDAPKEVVEEVRQAEAEASSEQKLAVLRLEETPSLGWKSDSDTWSAWERYREARQHESYTARYPEEPHRSHIQTMRFSRNRVGQFVVRSEETEYVLRYVVESETEIYIRATNATPYVVVVPDVPARSRFSIPDIPIDANSGGILRTGDDVFIARNTGASGTLIGRLMEVDHESRMLTIAYRFTKRRRTSVAP